jgi:2,4-dienoyl-CoA reductase-like NADH-dependent reductase (Old Yellow Enzyme family)
VEIRKQVRIPVIAANSVTTIERAKKLVDGGLVDFTAFARSILADYDWVNKVKEGREPNECIKCRHCTWFKGANQNCPARIKAVFHCKDA